MGFGINPIVTDDDQHKHFCSIVQSLLKKDIKVKHPEQEEEKKQEGFFAKSVKQLTHDTRTFNDPDASFFNENRMRRISTKIVS